MNILLMAPPAGGGGAGQQLILILLIGVVFYFFMIRPQTKKMKEQQNFINALKKGDKVVTVGGIHGTIAEVKEDGLLVEIAEGVKVKMDKSAVSLDSSKKLQKA